jgi:glycerol-3-phosphate dehydrogenase
LQYHNLRIGLTIKGNTVKRNLEKMASRTYDLLVIGGGITGACVAWDAVLRGLSVALVERSDFGGATSAATSKLIHGGLRYLRNMEFGLVRESLHERRILEIIAPHRVYPIPFIIPTYQKKAERVPLTIGMIAYELLAYDKASMDDKDKRIPSHKRLTPNEVLDIEPGIDQEGLTGGILYYDCQMYSPERLTLEFILSAASYGADVANYAAATGFIFEGPTVMGAMVRDVLNNSNYEIKARVVANATGPWADTLIGKLPGRNPVKSISRSKGIHVITPPISGDHALVLVTQSGRHVFIIPWRGHSLIGTTDTLYEGSPDEFRVTEEDITKFLEEVNEIYPSAHLGVQDILAFYGGLRPLVETDGSVDTYEASRRYEIQTHEEEEIVGLITAMGGKYTTSRSLAQKLIELVFVKLEEEPPPSRTEEVSLYGGNVGIYGSFLQRAIARKAPEWNQKLIEHLVRNYGSRFEDVLDYGEGPESLKLPLCESQPDIGMEIPYGIHEEMACRLSDILFRRTGIGTLGNPGIECIEQCATIMARELGWKRQRKKEEIAGALSVYRPGKE